MAKGEIDSEALKALLRLIPQIGRVERVAYVLKEVGAERYEEVAWIVRSVFLEERRTADGALHCLRRAWAKAFPEMQFPGAPKEFLKSRPLIDFHDVELKAGPQRVFPIAQHEGFWWVGSIEFRSYLGMYEHEGWTRLY